jgi:hypothetical protein
VICFYIYFIFFKILDESIKEVTTGILRQLNETAKPSIVTSLDSNSTNLNSNMTNSNANASGSNVNDSNTSDQASGHQVLVGKNSIAESVTSAGSDATKQLNRSVLTLNTV